MTVNRSKEDIITCLKYYIPIKYWNLNDWDIIVQRCTEVEEGIFQFRCSFFVLYFDNDMNPVTYGKMVVCKRKNNHVYYDFEKNLQFRIEPPIPLGVYDWEKAVNWGD